MLNSRINVNTAFAAGGLLLIAGCANSPYLDLEANQDATGTAGDATPATTAASAPQNRLAAVLARVAATAAATGDYQTAARLYRRAHGIAPNRIESALGLARSARAIGDHRGSVAAYKAVLRIDPDHFKAHEELGRQFMTLGAPRDAVPHLQAALERRPDIGLYNELGIAHDLAGDHDAAQKEFRTALALAPGDLTLRTNLGRSLAYSGRYEDAVRTLQAVANRPTATKRHREALAMALAAAGDVTAALRVTRADEKGENQASRRARYADMGGLVRSGDSASRMKLVAGSAQRDRHAAAIGQSRQAPAIAASAQPSGNSVHATVSTDIATETGPKPIYQTQNTALDSLGFTAGGHETHDYPPLEAPEPGMAETQENDKISPDQTPPAEFSQTVYRVQLGAYYSTRRAEIGWRQMVRKAPRALDGIDHVLIRPGSAGGTLLRLRTRAFEVKRQAQALCDDLRRNNLECIVVKTGQPHPNPSSDGIFMAETDREKPSKLGKITPAAGIAAPTRIVYRVQLAAYKSKRRAERGWRQLLQAAPDILDGIDHVVVLPETDNGALYRLRTQAFPEKRAARSLCDALQDSSLDCIVVKTGQTRRYPGFGALPTVSRIST